MLFRSAWKIELFPNPVQDDLGNAWFLGKDKEVNPTFARGAYVFRGFLPWPEECDKER